ASLVVNGDLTANNGAALNLDLAPGVTPLVVGGRANLDGAHLNVQLAATTTQRVSAYSAASARGGVTVNGTDVATTDPALLLILSYDPTTVSVTLLNTKVPLSSVATTPNALAAGKAV